KALSEVAQRLVVEAGAHLPAVDEAGAGKEGEDQCPQLGLPATATGGVTGDDAGLGQPGLDLHPVRASDARAVEGIGALADDALDAGAASHIEQRGPVTFDVRREEDVR